MSGTFWDKPWAASIAVSNGIIYCAGADQRVYSHSIRSMTFSSAAFYDDLARLRPSHYDDLALLRPSHYCSHGIPSSFSFLSAPFAKYVLMSFFTLR